METMKTNRQYNQIIDLEYFCHRDLDADDKGLHLRDRNIFLKNQGLPGNKPGPTNSQLVRLWLNERIQEEFPVPESKSPGTIFGDAYLLARSLMTVTGVIAGLVASFAFFTYTGTTPVNVFHFLLIFVVSQLTLVGFLCAACLLRPLFSRLKTPSFYTVLFRGLIGKIVSFLHKHWLGTMSAEKRVSVSHAFGIFKARSTVYGSLFYWPLFALSQLFAIGFNIGLLAATLVKISTSDLAFGWQSTMQFSTEAIHRGVMLAALPWSWFVSETNSYPTLAEIEGSRIILKEGIYHLTTGDLIAWWPFLVFCLIFYGLFTRVVLFFIGKVIARHSLQNLKFDTPACLALIRRMQTPLVSTQAAPEGNKTASDNHSELNKQLAPAASPDLSGQEVLIPDDIYSLCSVERLTPVLQSKGLAINEIHKFMVSYDKDQQLKQLLTTKQWQPGEGIFILMEGWMVPLVDFLSYLKELRAILPKNTIIHLGLIGRPEANSFTPVTPSDLALWQQKIIAAGDPYLTVFSLIS